MGIRVAHKAAKRSYDEPRKTKTRGRREKKEISNELIKELVRFFEDHPGSAQTILTHIRLEEQRIIDEETPKPKKPASQPEPEPVRRSSSSSWHEQTSYASSHGNSCCNGGHHHYHQMPYDNSLGRSDTYAGRVCCGCGTSEPNPWENERR